MSNVPHIYGTPEPEDKQGEATRETQVGDNRDLGKSYKHELQLDEGKVVVVEETSGVAFAEIAGDICRAESPKTGIDLDKTGNSYGVQTRWLGESRNVATGVAVGVASWLLANFLRRTLVRSMSATGRVS